MIRSELVQMLAADNPGLSAREIERIVDTFFEEITSRLVADGRVELRGFGAFSTRAHRAQPAHRRDRRCLGEARALFQAWQGNARAPERLTDALGTIHLTG